MISSNSMLDKLSSCTSGLGTTPKCEITYSKDQDTVKVTGAFSSNVKPGETITIKLNMIKNLPSLRPRKQFEVQIANGNG
jgi:hypothetical protein